MAQSYSCVIIVSLDWSSAYLMQLQYLLADPLVPGVVSVSRGGFLGSLVSFEYLMMASLVPQCNISNSRWLL